MVSNGIPVRQNEEAALKLMRARQWTYKRATKLMVLQIVLTVMVPVAAAVATIWFPALRPHVAAVALLTLVADTAFLDGQYKWLIKLAAKLGEKFDCLVLDLPWNDFVAGDQPEAEDIRSASRQWSKHSTDNGLRDWYPIAAGEMPMALARIVCQRTNLRYDSQLRRSFGTVILAGVAIIVVGLFVIGLLQDLNLTAWVLLLAPATPLLSWAGREYYRQRDTADQLEEMMKKARSVWNRALAGTCDEMSCSREARELQNAIYLRRSTSPLVMPHLYKIKRLGLEDEMNEAANDFLEEYRAFGR